MMELIPGELCIGLSHSAFLGAVAVGSTAAVALSIALGRLGRRVRSGHLSQASCNLIWFGALTALFFGTVGLMNILFKWMHPDLALCTSVVGPWLFVPPIVSFVGAVAYGTWDRKRQSEEAPEAPLAQ